jgi:hypothetical protein
MAARSPLSRARWKTASSANQIEWFSQALSRGIVKLEQDLVVHGPRLAKELAVMADRIAELDGVSPAGPRDPEAVSTKAAVLVADLVEPARSTALDKLDESRQAMTIATSWSRSNARPRSAASDPEGPPEAATL